MTTPALILGFVVATLLGALYHLWRNGGFTRLLLFIFLSWLGFTAGQITGAALNITIWQVGTLLLGSATLGSLIFLFIGDWLIRPPP